MILFTYSLLFLIVYLVMVFRSHQRMQKKLDQIILLVQPVKEEAGFIEFYTIINGQKVRVFHMFLKATQKLPVSIVAKDKFGNMAKVDGAAQFALSDESMGTISSTGEMSAEFIPSGKAGIVTLQGKVDADLGEGVKEILGTLEVEVLAGDAEVVEMAAGEPVDV